MSVNIVKYLSQIKDSELGSQIFASSVDTLPHRLEVLKSEKQKNRHEIKQVFTENINDYLDSHEITTKLKNEITKLGTTSKNISSSISNALGKIKVLKSQNEQSNNINSKINLYKSFHQSNLMNIFEVEEKIKLCVRFELFQEAHDLFMWYFKVVSSRKDKNYEVLKYFRHHIDTLKLSIFEYMLLNLKKTKFQRISNMIRDFIQNGEFDLDKLVPVLFPLYFNFTLKHKLEKVLKNASTDTTPAILAAYPKTFDKVIRLLQESLGENPKVLLNELHVKLISREYFKFERILKFMMKGTDESLILRFGPELHQIAPRCFINFKSMIVELVDKLEDRSLQRLKTRFKPLLRVLRYSNSFDKFLAVDIKNLLPTDRDESKSKAVLGAEHVSKIFKEKRGTEVLHILINNFQNIYSLKFVYHNDQAVERAKSQYIELRDTLLSELERYLQKVNPDLHVKYMEKLRIVEPILYESLCYCISE